MLLKKILYYLNPKNYFNREKGDLNIRAMHSIKFGQCTASTRFQSLCSW